MIVYTTRPSGAAPRPAPGPDARPLYIASGSDTRVRLDGRALCVQREERPEQLFPLVRIARVHTSVRAEWSTEALMACADYGIGVLFVEDDGTVQARLLGRPGERDELLHRFSEFLLLPQAADQYGFWLGVAPKAAREPRSCRAWIEHQAVQYAGSRGAERTRQWLRTLCYQWMQAHLLDLGFGRQSELAQIGEPSLPRDLAELLMWYMEPPRIGWLRRRFDAARHRGEPLCLPRHADTVRLFESRAARVAKRGRDLTGALHRWLIAET
jgi:hypothetical protein